MNTYKKIIILLNTIKNWPLILIDKLGVIKICKYITKDNLIFFCRSKTTDINEVTVISSGYEYPTEYLKLSSEDKVVLDIGAYIGTFCVYYNYVNTNVKYNGFAIEPFEENFSLLKKNCEVNNVNNFALFNCAIGGVDGWVNFNINAQPDSVKISEQGSHKVKSLKLSSFCKENNIDHIELLKMDIEGAEYDVLETDYNFILNHVDKIIMEYHNNSNKKDLRWILEKINKEYQTNILHTVNNGGILFAIKK